MCKYLENASFVSLNFSESATFEINYCNFTNTELDIENSFVKKYFKSDFKANTL